MKMYYLENKERGLKNGKVQWWAKNNAGYTCDINEAKEFTKQEADKILSTSSAKYNKHESDYVKFVAMPYIVPCQLFPQPQHTPGPWQVSQKLKYSINNGHKHIANVSIRHSANINQAENEANARLIAAAPELLEALKLAIGLPYAIQPTNWQEMAKKAITKAEGIPDRLVGIDKARAEASDKKTTILFNQRNKQQ